MAWGWRLPFLASVVLVGIGLWVRIKLTETPDFKAALAQAPPPPVPLGEVTQRHLGVLVAGTFGVIACFAIYYLSTAFALGYGTANLGYDRTQFLAVQLVAILFMAGGIVAAGILSDRHDPRSVLMGGCVAGVAAGFLLAPMMESGGLLQVGAFLAIGLAVMGFVYGPLGAWLPGLFPARVRYTGVSIAFNMGGILGGGLTPIFAQILADHGGLMLVGLYLSVACGLSFIALATVRR